MLRVLLVASFFSCAGCGPYCGLGDGPGGSYNVTIRSSLGMFPSDLVIAFEGYVVDRCINRLHRGPQPLTLGAL